jgi:hypothetical protein
LDFLPKDKLCLFMPNPSDSSFEVLDNYNNSQCSMDVFFALSHGVHRGGLKKGKFDDFRIFFRLKNLFLEHK